MRQLLRRLRKQRQIANNESQLAFGHYRPNAVLEGRLRIPHCDGRAANQDSRVSPSTASVKNPPNPVSKRPPKHIHVTKSPTNSTTCFFCSFSGVTLNKRSLCLGSKSSVGRSVAFFTRTPHSV